MDKIIKDFDDFENYAREIYRCFMVPLYRLKKKDLIDALKKINQFLENLSDEIMNRSRKYNIQEAKESNSQKLQLFAEDFLVLSKRAAREVYLEENKIEVDSDLISIKEEITKPEIYFTLEKDIKNILNIFFDYLQKTKEGVEYKFQNVSKQKRSVDDLLKILDHKDEKIQELNQNIKKYEILDAQTKVKHSKLSELEIDLIKKTKVNERDLTIVKLHIIQVEKELDSLYRNIRTLTNDIKQLENKYNDKEKASLELIKELKDELLSARYLLSKKN